MDMFIMGILIGIFAGFIIGYSIDWIISKERRKTKKCKWVADKDGTYHTSCNHQFYTIDDTATEHGYIACQFCGKKSKIIEYDYVKVHNEKRKE